MKRNDVADIVRWHKPNAKQIEEIERVRASAEYMIRTIYGNTPKCADQAAAVRKVREAMMTANAAIVLKGRI